MEFCRSAQHGENTFNSADDFLYIAPTSAAHRGRSDAKKFKRLISPKPEFLRKRERVHDVRENEIIINDAFITYFTAVNSTAWRSQLFAVCLAVLK